VYECTVSEFSAHIYNEFVALDIHYKVLQLCTFGSYPYYTTPTSQRVEIKLHPLSMEEVGKAMKYTFCGEADQ